MKATTIIKELKAIGFNVSLDGQNVRLRYPKNKTYPPEAAPLIEELRAHKAEAITILRGKAIEQVQAFDSKGYLLNLIEQGKRERWKDSELFAHIDRARHTGELQGPWGILIHDSPVIAGGSYWLLSCETTRGQIPVEDIGFTLAEVRQLKLISTVFQGARIMQVLKETATTHRGRG